MKTTGVPLEKINKGLQTFYDMDQHFNDGRVLGSMCTRPLPVAIRAHTKFIEANLGNSGLYPGTKKMETNIVGSLNKLLHNPKGCGRIVGGGTEANIMALWIAKKITGKNEVIAPRSKHFSFCKATDLMNMKARVVELDENYKVCIDDVEDMMNKNTAAVVGVAGTTELGVIDPIDKLSDLCREKTFLHVDAAFGGFVIPFLKRLGHDLPDFDFRLPGVSSLTIDPHKMGCSTQPAGAHLLRKKEYEQTIEVKAPYLTLTRQATLSGTRNSASVAATWATMEHLGIEGYTKIVKRCYDNTQYLKRRMIELGVDPVIEPVMNILALKLKDPKAMEKALAAKGWYVSKVASPCSLRLVVMPHNRRGTLREFVDVFGKTAKRLKEI